MCTLWYVVLGVRGAGGCVGFAVSLCAWESSEQPATDGWRAAWSQDECVLTCSFACCDFTLSLFCDTHSWWEQPLHGCDDVMICGMSSINLQYISTEGLIH